MEYDFTSLNNELKKIEEWLGKEYFQVHTGRATPMILDGVQVDSYGSYVLLKTIASITVEDARTLRIIPWDKSQIKDIEHAITAANTGLSLAVDDAGVRAIFPQLTTERREELVRAIKKKLEEARISVRGAREAVWDDIQNKEKTGDITEDDKFMYKDELQKFIDEVNKNLESIFEGKEKELLEK